jgi:phosphatidylglycerol:prolipoprotein diacylglycerol transferase
MYPVLLDLGGGLVIYSYSVFLALGYLVAYWVVSTDVSRRKMDPTLPSTLLLACFIAGLLGAKILFLYQNVTLTEFLANPSRYFASGYASIGGLIGIFCALWIVSRLKRTDFQGLLDIVCPALILGHGVGRIGCFLNGCDYGTACSLPWAVSFSERVVNVHPTQLYDTLFMALLFVFLWKIRTENRPTGFVSAVGFVILGTQRFFIEFIRETTPSFIEGLSQAQLAALLLVVVFGIRLFQLSGSVLGKQAQV